MKNVLIFLDLSQMDESLLNHLKPMDEHLQLGKICLLHYMELQDLTDDVSSHFPNMDRPIEEVISEEIEQHAKAAGLESGRYEINVVTKGKQRGLIEWINNSDYDLCVFGKKVVHRGTGALSGKLARLVEKSILFITESSRFNLRQVLVPVDFSKYAKRSLRFAADLVKSSDSELIGLHVYKLPAAYFPYIGERSEHLEKKQRDESQRKLDGVCKECVPDQAIRCEVEYADQNNVSDTIYNFARTNYTDLIVMGLKGKTDNDELLIGTVAQRLIQPDRDVSVLLVK